VRRSPVRGAEHKRPQPWLVDGAMVDYHAVIGGPITQYSMHVRTGPRQLSDGGAWVVWLDGKAGCVAVEACTEATGSLGPSNDDSPAVQIEMRAAELEDTEHWGPAYVAISERWGFADHRHDDGRTYEGQSSTAAYEAGFLAAEIESHEVRDHRDATAWSWDISRPIAEQLAAADDAGEAQDAANTAALVADLDARGPAYDAINDAFDAEDDAEDAPVCEIHKPDGAL
jgi:hypothetical protein